MTSSNVTRHKVEVRRTQSERSKRTREWLLEATVQSLTEVGYVGTSTVEVANRAGVSRGAQQHHFPTKEELVLAAVEWLFHRRLAEFREAFAKLPESADRRAAALELLWKFIGKGPTFYAWLELAIAGRTDPTLGKRVRELGTRTAQEVEDTFRELFPAPSRPNPYYDLAPRFAFAVLQGLAVNHLMVAERKAAPEEIIKLMKQLSMLLSDGGA
jgi:AcrR family transcriptional regulator